MSKKKTIEFKVVPGVGGYIMGDGNWDYKKNGDPETFFKNCMAGFVRHETAGDLTDEEAVAIIEDMGEAVDKAEKQTSTGDLLMDIYEQMGVAYEARKEAEERAEADRGFGDLPQLPL